LRLFVSSRALAIHPARQNRMQVFPAVSVSHAVLLLPENTCCAVREQVLPGLALPEDRGRRQRGQPPSAAKAPVTAALRLTRRQFGKTGKKVAKYKA
jgi:hypothetical protein